MEEYHELLKSQIKQFLGDTYPISPELKKLLGAVNQTYKVCETHPLLHQYVLTGNNHEREKRLQSAVSLFKAIQEDQTEFVCRFLPDGTLTYANNASCRHFGQDKTEVLGKSLLSLLPKETADYMRTVIQSLTPENPVREVQQAVVLPNGNTRWHQWTNKAFFDENGQFIEIVGIGRDITDRKKAEDELKESEERYRILFEAAFEGIVVHENGILLDVNQTCLQTLQYTREELIGTSLLLYIAPEYQDLVKERIKNRLDYPYEAAVLKKDGSRIIIEVIAREHVYQGRNVRIVAFRNITERKKFEQEIQSQRAFLTKILDTLPFNVFMKDREGRFAFVNKNTLETLKKPASEVLGKTDFDIFPEEVAERFTAEDWKVWQNGNSLISAEEKVFVQDHFMQLISYKTIIQTENPERPLLLRFSIDITDRALAEEELRSQEMFFRQILDTVPNLIFVKDGHGNFMMVNRAVAELFGMTKEEVILKKNYQVCQNSGKSSVFYKNDREVIEKGEVVALEESFSKPNGEVLWFYTIKKPLYIKDQGAHVLVVSTDITQQKRILEKLKASELKFRQLVENATDMIYGCNYKGNFVYANPVACQVLGYSENELRKKHYTEFVSPEYVSVLEAFYQRQSEERISDTYVEFKGVNRFGKEIWVGQNVHMLMEGNWVKGFQTVARDITDRKKAEEEIIKAKQMAEQSMKAKEQFLSVMSHEIRTPLNAVIGLTHLLLEEDPLSRQIEQLNAIKFSADNLMVIINDILDFSKIESGKINFESIDFELSNIFKGIEQSFSFKAEENNIKLLFKIDEKMPGVLIGDPVRLNQVLLNLVSNALKFTEKGYIEVQANLLEKNQSDVKVEFRVIDTGIGIPTDKLTHIFESFTQASSETTRKYGGTGLGLTITKRLVELQKGSISVTSKVGLGSTFTFNLTFGVHSGRAKRKPAAPVRKKSAVNDLNGIRILLVEDNKMNRLVASKFLERWGIEIDIAEDGLEAIERLKQHTYQMILMDLQMPNMDGYATTHFIRNNMHAPLREVPILALTASALIDVKHNVLDAGMNDFISKPFDPRELHSKILKYAKGFQKKNDKNKAVDSEKYRYVDLHYLEEISANDKGFMVEMIKLFIRQTPDFLENLQTACDTANWASIRYITHKLKATIATIGIAELHPVIAQLEEYANQQTHLDIIAKLVDKIAKVCAEVYHELHEKLEMIHK